MTPINVMDKLPPDKTYVLVHYTGGNWHDKDHQVGCEWKVAKFVRGLSKQERETMLECERKHVYYNEDEMWNNHRAYSWHEFGPGSLFGQDVDYWAPLPEIPA